MITALASLALAASLFAQQAPDNLWTPDCQYLSQYGLGDAVRVQCDQVTFDFLEDYQGNPYVQVTDGDAQYDIPPALFIQSHDPEYAYLWIDTTAGSVCGVQFGSHVPFVQCASNAGS